MKGIILAGDSGTRLNALTVAIPKQLLPLYDKPMVFYAIDLLVQSGVKDILIITSPEHQYLFKKTLGDGSLFGANFSYDIQYLPEGIAQAISIGAGFINHDHICLITGDTVILGESFIQQLHKAYKTAEKSGNATIFTDRSNDEIQYGRVVVSAQGKAKDIVGKSNSPLDLSIAGIYVFPKEVVECVKNIYKSERNLFEITDVNKIFNDKHKLQVQVINNKCQWLDTNSFDSLLYCAQIIKKARLTDKK